MRPSFASLVASVVTTAFAFAAAISPSACSSPDGEVALTRTSPARALGVHSSKLPANTEEQARQALVRDARRREQRFVDATKPGHLHRATLVEAREIEAGLWSPEEIFQIGAQLFDLTYTKEIGFGGRDLPPIARFHRGARGGPDATHCAQCHWRGGPAGAGDGADNAYLGGDGDAQSSALARNPIALVGDGWIEILAREMTEELRARRLAAAAAAARSGEAQKVSLAAKGVSFGSIAVAPDGKVDARLLEGVDADLVVRPFGHKGTFATLRDAVEDALNVHHGMQSSYLARTGAPDRVGPFASPDPDGDGHMDEITEGQVSALTLFVAMQEVPRVEVPTRLSIPTVAASDLARLWADGRAKFGALGCASCHTPSLPVRGPRFVLPSRMGGPDFAIDLAVDGAEPRLAKGPQGTYDLELYSDLKRHDMGPALREPRPDRGVAEAKFLTRPLWGVARSRPYLHDGRAPTLEDAIVLHGGEAQQARDAFVALPERERAGLRVFLTSLTRARRIVVP